MCVSCSYCVPFNCKTSNFEVKWLNDHAVSAVFTFPKLLLLLYFIKSGRHDLNVRPLRPEQGRIFLMIPTEKTVKYRINPVFLGLSRNQLLYYSTQFFTFVNQKTSLFEKKRPRNVPVNSVMQNADLQDFSLQVE